MKGFTKNASIIALLLPLCVWAQEARLSDSEVKRQLKRLTDQHQYAEALQLAEANLGLEGDAEFDFYYGLSAMQTGQYQPALFSFERLSSSFPQVQRYRLELARSYYHLGNLERAESEFKKVLATNPPLAVQQNIQRFLDRIEQQRKQLNPSWQASVSVAGGYDSNINSATNDPSFDVTLFGIPFTATLTPEQRRFGSYFGQLRAIASYNSPLSQYSAWDFSISGSHKANEEISDFDLSNIGMQTGMRWLNGPMQYRVGVTANQLWQDAEQLQNDVGLSADMYWRPSQQWQPFARLQFTWINNQINDDQDMLRPQLQLGTSWIQKNISAQIAVSYSSDISQNDADYQARDILGLTLSGQYSFNKGDLYASVMWRDNQFQAPSYDLIVAGRTRDEQTQQALLGYRHRILDSLTAYAQYSYLNNASNINIYEYSRSLTEAGLTLTF